MSEHPARRDLPTQICAWHYRNIVDASEGPAEQWLYALKATEPGDRQLVWEAGTDRGIIGVVDFGTGAVRVEGIYYAWGRFTDVMPPLTPDLLRNEAVLAERFFGTGKGWLHGRAKRCPIHIAEAIDRLTGGLPSRRPPDRDPSEAPADRWFGGIDVDPECVFELAVIASRSLQRTIGFARPLITQRHITPGSRPDLLSDGTIGEVKRAIAPRDVMQVERYLADADEHLARRGGWRAVMIHGGRLTPAVTRRLSASRDSARIEVWRLDERRRGGFKAVRER